MSCAQNSEGCLYIVYTGNRTEVQVFDSSGKFKYRFGERGANLEPFSSYICGIAINQKDEVYVSDVFNKKVFVFDKLGKKLREFSSILGVSKGAPKQETYPAHIAIGPDDRFYISDGQNGQIYIYTMEGAFLNFLGGSEPGLFPSAGHISFNSKNQICILEGLANCIQCCSPEGKPLVSIGKSGSNAGQFLRISGLAIDSRDRIYVSDIVQSVIQIFNEKGTLIGVTKEIVTQKGTQRLKAPSYIYIDKNNLIYVIEQPLHRVIVLRDYNSTAQ